MNIAGVMSGSSLDGLDIAIVRFDPETDWEFLWSYSMPYSIDWVNRLKNYHQLSAAEYITLKFDFSRYIGQLLIDCFKNYSEKIDFVGFHGHTMMHLPEVGITEQIGNGGILSGMIAIPTITDFRTQDIAKDGVGTPLAPLVEVNLFSGHKYYLNLGGIANITNMIDENAIVAYDVCPCNQVLNHFSNLLGKEYDDGGQIARTGSINPDVFNYLNSLQYINQAPPKSIDNNWIVNSVIPNTPSAKTEDVLHTFTHWMAECIANEIDSTNAPTSLMVSGGGTHNIYFMESLEAQLSKKNCILKIPEKEIIDNKEAILMALMAYKYLIGESNVLSSVTGATSDSIGGALYKVM